MSRIKELIARLRRRSPFFDHLLSTFAHFSGVRSNILAGGVTYYAFLSFFPILLLAFYVVGKISGSYPDAEQNLQTAINDLFPGIIAEPGKPATDGQITFEQIQSAQSITGPIGALGVLYAGLGWVSGLRNGLSAAFKVGTTKNPNFVVGKLKDLLLLVTIGVVLVVSVSVASATRALTSGVLDIVQLDGTLAQVPVWAAGVVVGVAASMLMFFLMYRLLPNTQIPSASLWRGGLLAAILFEAVKALATYVIALVGGSPLASLAIAVTLLVWIFYFSMIIMLGAAWAYTDRRAVAVRDEAAASGRAERVRVGAAIGQQDEQAGTAEEPVGFARPAAVLGAIALVAWGWLRREKSRENAAR